MLPIIQLRKYLYLLSGALILASVVVLAIWGLRLGIDFKGGTLVEVSYAVDPVPQSSDVGASLGGLGLQSLTIQASGEKGMIIRYLASDDAMNDRVIAKLREMDPDIVLLRTDFIGASVSDQIKKSAVWGIILSILGIAGYIALAFRRVTRPISSWGYGWGAVIALAHDVLITVGVFAVLGRYLGVEVGVPFVAALLTILGYSVNDTIVVYDRIRENLLRSRANTDFESIVNRSVNETIARSVNTSMTVIIVLFALVLFGGEGIKWFSVTLLVGVTFGTYSSIFVASALLVSYHKLRMAK